MNLKNQLILIITTEKSIQLLQPNFIYTLDSCTADSLNSHAWNLTQTAIFIQFADCFIVCHINWFELPSIAFLIGSNCKAVAFLSFFLI